MTIIAVRNGIMAVDSQLTSGTLKQGEVKKWFEVSEVGHGGYVAGCGQCSEVLKAALQFAETGTVDSIPDDSTLVHINKCGDVFFNQGGDWIFVDAEFFAEGSGRAIAVGAMAQGATAEEAARIACKFDSDTGGTVYVLNVREDQ